MPLSQSCKGKLAFGGGIIHMILLGAVGILGSFSVYFTSYFKSIDPSLSLHYSYFYQPISTFFVTIFGFIGGFIDHKFWANITILSGGIVMFFGAILMHFAKNVRYGYFCMMVFGTGFGISTAIAMKNLCLFYPSKKGLFYAILQSMMNLSSAGFNIIGEKLINPNDDGIVLALAAYSPEISQNFRKYLEFLMFVIPIGVFLTMGVIREYEDIKEIPFDKKSELVEEIIKDKEENKDNLSNENKDTNINNVEKEEIQPMKKKELVTPIKQENTGLSNK